MFRNESAVEFESSLERDFVIRQEFFLGVLDVVSQPCEIPFRLANGREFTYTPDFLVYYRLGSQTYETYPKPLLVEVKPAALWRQNWRKWLTKWKAAHRYAQTMGWRFHILDESRIRDTTFENIAFLQPYARMAFDEAESEWIVSALRDIGSASVDHLLATHFMGIYRANGISHLWHLLATRRLDCDITRPLNHQTELWVADHGI